MRRIIFAGILFITFAFFYVFQEPSHSSFGTQKENILGQNKNDYTHTVSNSGDNQWAKTYGGLDDDTGSLAFEKSDGSGYILAGDTFSFDFGGTYMGDIWILDLSPSGDIVWQRTYGRYDLDLLFGGVQETGDGGYIVLGYTYSFDAGGADFWVLKLTSSGDIEWQRIYGKSETEDYPHSIQITSDGGYIVAGGTESFGAGDLDLWVLKLTSSGDVEWQNTYGGNFTDRAHSIQQTDDAGYIAAGVTKSFGAGGADFWVLKLTSSGDIEWQQTYGGSLDDWGMGIQESSVGGYVVSGWTKSFGAGGVDFWILKLTSSGDIEWQQTYGGNFDDWGGNIQETGDGGYLVTGETESYGAGDQDGWILKLTSSGDVDWERTYGGIDRDGISSIQETSDGGYIVSGSTKSFGAFLGEFDLWLLKLSHDGNICPSCEIIGSSDAVVTETNVSPSDTNITPQMTDVTPKNTDVTPEESDAITHLLCLSLPNAPTTLEAKAKSRDKIKLKWRDNSCVEDGFQVERKKGKKGKWETIKTLRANRRRYTDKKLEAEKLYRYRVRAFNVSGYSAYSKVAQVKTKK